MERYSMFLGRKNPYCENGSTTKFNLQIQCDPYQITNGIFSQNQNKKFHNSYGNTNVPKQPKIWIMYMNGKQKSNQRKQTLGAASMIKSLERRVYLTRDMHGDKVTVLVNFLNHFLTIESVSVIFHVKGESKSLREFVRYYES